jgi:hypothetical protein
MHGMHEVVGSIPIGSTESNAARFPGGIFSWLQQAGPGGGKRPPKGHKKTAALASRAPRSKEILRSADRDQRRRRIAPIAPRPKSAAAPGAGTVSIRMLSISTSKSVNPKKKPGSSVVSAISS